MSENGIAMAIVREMVRAWIAVEGTSACDLLDDCCNAAINAGLVTQEQIDKWAAEDEAANEESET